MWCIVTKMILLSIAIITLHMPIFIREQMNRRLVLIMAPNKVPYIAHFALFMACKVVVKGL